MTFRTSPVLQSSSHRAEVALRLANGLNAAAISDRLSPHLSQGSRILLEVASAIRMFSHLEGVFCAAPFVQWTMDPQPKPSSETCHAFQPVGIGCD